MSTVPHVRTPQPILDTVEFVLAGRPLGLPPARIETLVARRLGAALPAELPIASVLEELVASGRGEWVSSRGGAWRIRLFAEGESAPTLDAGATTFEAIPGSALGDAAYVNYFPYRQIDYLDDGRVIITAVSLTRNTAAIQASNWIRENEMIRETRIERNLGRGRWGVTDRWQRGRDNTIRHSDAVAAAIRAQRHVKKDAPERDLGL